MKLKDYSIYLADSTTHKVTVLICCKVDGYVTALAEARKICNNDYPGLYVCKVEPA